MRVLKWIAILVIVLVVAGGLVLWSGGETAKLPAEAGYGPKPNLPAPNHTLGAVLRDLKQFPQAVAELEASLSMYRKLHTGDHPSVARALRDLGDCLGRASAAGDGTSADADQKAAERAIPVLEEALAMTTRLFMGDRPQVADALAALGDAWNRVGKPERAAEYLRRADEMRKAMGLKPAMKP